MEGDMYLTQKDSGADLSSKMNLPTDTDIINFRRVEFGLLEGCLNITLVYEYPQRRYVKCSP